MAYNVVKIDPLDLQPRKAVGVSIPFSAKAVFNSTYTTQDAIKTNLINYFLTGQQERVFNPEFGASLRNLLFEQITEQSIERISEQVKSGLNRYFPSVVIGEMLLVPSPDTNTVDFLLKYSVKDTNIEDLITINFEN
jgi:phage baseplate assembly protein W